MANNDQVKAIQLTNALAAQAKDWGFKLNESTGKHVDEYRAEDSPSPHSLSVTSQGQRRRTIANDKAVQEFLILERAPLGYAKLMEDIFS